MCGRDSRESSLFIPSSASVNQILLFAELCSKMEGISVLTDDAILYVLQYLDMQDRIAFAYTCERFKQICMNTRAFRKVDLSERLILRKQQAAINEFFGDKQMAKYIKELNLSNHRVMTWQMNDHLEEFITSICPQLEALQLLNCGMSFQTLHRILKQAPKLTSLSWSFMDFTPQDTKFLMNDMKSCDGMCLKNIKHLHLEILESKSHNEIQIVNYLLLSHFQYIEELEIFMWVPSSSDLSSKFQTCCEIPAFPQPSVSISDSLPRLHTLIVAEIGKPWFSSLVHTTELSKFVLSVMRKKSCETKWKKLWIAPKILCHLLYLIDVLTFSDNPWAPLPTKNLHELQPIEAVTAWPSLDTVDDIKTLFQKTDDSTVKNLHVHLPCSRTGLIPDICKPILRTGGCSLKFLSLFVSDRNFIYPEAKLFFNMLFSGCLNIKDLDLHKCHFGHNICEALSKLKHLEKIQLRECAIHSGYNENQVEITKANLLTVVENCQNITDLYVRGCYDNHFSSRSIDDDLMALAKLRKLKSLTLYDVSGIKEWTFLPNITTHCKLLTMLRILTLESLNKSCILVILKSAKFLKHLAITVPELDLGSEDPWKLLGRATNLERLCITTYGYMGSPSVSGAVEMLKNLPRLHVLHLHSGKVQNIQFFCDEMIRMLQEESDYYSYIEIVGHHMGFTYIWGSTKTLPLNSAELCQMSPCNSKVLKQETHPDLYGRVNY